MAEFWKVGQEVLDLAEALIDAYHEDLREARIGILFRDEAPQSRGRWTLGKAGKVSPKWAALIAEGESEPLDFVIWLAHDRWEFMTKKQRKALLDHELQHCYMEDGQAKLRGHDLEEFNVIVERHGLWHHAVFEMANSMEKAKQLTIPFEERARGEVVAIGPSLGQLQPEGS